MKATFAAVFVIAFAYGSGCVRSGVVEIIHNSPGSLADGVARHTFSNMVNKIIDKNGLRNEPLFMAAIEASPIPRLIPMEYRSNTNVYVLGFREGFALGRTKAMLFSPPSYRYSTPQDAAYAEGWLRGHLLGDSIRFQEILRAGSSVAPKTREEKQASESLRDNSENKNKEPDDD